MLKNNRFLSYNSRILIKARVLVHREYAIFRGVRIFKKKLTYLIFLNNNFYFCEYFYQKINKNLLLNRLSKEFLVRVEKFKVGLAIFMYVYEHLRVSQFNVSTRVLCVCI